MAKCKSLFSVAIVLILAIGIILPGYAAALLQTPGLSWEKLFEDGCEASTRKDYRIAEQFLNYAIEMAGTDRDKVMLSMGALEQLYDEEGDYTREESLLLRSVKLLTKDPRHVPGDLLGNAYARLAAISCYLRRYSDAEQYQKSAIYILEAAYGPLSPDLGVCLNNLGWIEDRLHKTAAAEVHFKQALALFAHTKLTNTMYYGCAANSLAEIYMSTGRGQQALVYFRKSIDALTRSMGPDHVLVQLVKARYNEVLESQQHHTGSNDATKRHLKPIQRLPKGICFLPA